MSALGAIALAFRWLFFFVSHPDPFPSIYLPFKIKLGHHLAQDTHLKNATGIQTPVIFTPPTLILAHPIYKPALSLAWLVPPAPSLVSPTVCLSSRVTICIFCRTLLTINPSFYSYVDDLHRDSCTLHVMFALTLLPHLFIVNVHFLEGLKS